MQALRLPDINIKRAFRDFRTFIPVPEILTAGKIIPAHIADSLRLITLFPIVILFHPGILKEDTPLFKSK